MTYTWPVRRLNDLYPEPPWIDDNMPLSQVMQLLANHLIKIIDVPRSFEELRTAVYGHSLGPLVDSLSRDVHHPAILPALLALRGHFLAHDENDDRHLNQTRGYACEVVAWRFVNSLSEREAIDHLLKELPPSTRGGTADLDPEGRSGNDQIPIRLTPEAPTERSSLLSPNGAKNSRSRSPAASLRHPTPTDNIECGHFLQLATSFAGLNALEIATVSNAKKFLSQRPVQRIIDGLWDGTYVFWQTLSAGTRRRPSKWDASRADPYCRLRVPKYLKIYEILFFAIFISLYYSVLIPRTPSHITAPEILLLIWIASFAYDELGQYMDAGMTFYAADFWSLWDFGIVAIGGVFLVLRITGLVKGDLKTTDKAFDVLSLEALLLFPRICSLLSLTPFFGTLIPCLREMAKYSTKFLGLVIILYLGFLSTFVLLARNHYSPGAMALMLTKVFFGSTYLGFDAANNISPVLGLPLMLIFVWMTNILLLTSLISLLSNSITEVMSHAREEYLFQYSVFVLEASTSNRLTYFFPPLNLISLLLRPLRLFISPEALRHTRIVLLKITHAPHVALITALEKLAPRARPRGAHSSWAKIIEGPAARRQPTSTLKATVSLLSSPAYTAHLRGGLRERSESSPSPSIRPRRAQTSNFDGTGESFADHDRGTQAQIADLSMQVKQLNSKMDDLIRAVGRQQDLEMNTD